MNILNDDKTPKIIQIQIIDKFEFKSVTKVKLDNKNSPPMLCECGYNPNNDKK